MEILEERQLNHKRMAKGISEDPGHSAAEKYLQHEVSDHLETIKESSKMVAEGISKHSEYREAIIK